MPDISATFSSDYSESRKWVIVDTGRDPNAPPVVFDGYLEPNGVTPPIALYSDGFGAHVTYQRSDGAPTNVDVSDGDAVRMS
jgi:hypothetical protein